MTRHLPEFAYSLWQRFAEQEVIAHFQRNEGSMPEFRFEG